MKYKEERDRIIYWAKRLNQKGLVTARSGNISCRTKDNQLLVTSHDSYLGDLEREEILVTNLKGETIAGKRKATSEINLHTGIYEKFRDIEVVIHAHPGFTTAFFHYYDKLEIFSFEAELYLQKLGIVPQETVNVTQTGPVFASLENNPLVVLKNHGVVSIGKDFKSAFGLIELLEEQAKVNLILKTRR